MEISVNLIWYRHCEWGASCKCHWETGKAKECGDPKSGYFQLISIYSQRSIGISAHMNLLWCKMNDITDIVWYR